MRDNPMLPQHCILFMLCGLHGCLPSWAHASDEVPPTIIVILADDMGYADAGFTGASDIKTPNLDALAASGVVFSQGYCNHPFCAPSRAALLSGRYQQRFGFEDNPAYDPSNNYLGIDPNEKLFPERLREVGYTTGAIGKWHLGAAAAFHPNNRGFTYFYGFLGGGHDYFAIDTRQPLQSAYLQPLERNGKPAVFDGYLTTDLSEDAARFIADNQSRPFFLYLAYNAPHTPLQAPEEAIERYAHVKDDKRRVYSAMVDVMDSGIGLVTEELEKHDLRENTMVFFLSDNGGPQAMPWNTDFSNGSSNAPFRGGKTNLYEGGIHVPFVVSWPARIPAGNKYDHPISALDIARTAVECGGGNGAAEPALEGVNLIPYITGEAQGPPHDAIYWRDKDGQRWAISNGNGYKYVQDKIGGKPELFFLSNDQSEKNDLLAERSDLAQELQAKWESWNRQNITGRIGNYLEYFDLRARFHLDSIPERARSEGFPSETTQ